MSWDPEEIMRKHRFLKRFHTLLLNRWYIPVLYYEIGMSAIKLSRFLYKHVEMEGFRSIRGINEFFDLTVRWMISLSKEVYSSVELEGFEKFNRKIAEKLTNLSQWAYSSVEIGGFEKFNRKVAEVTMRFSEKLRLTQTGDSSHNIVLMVLGMVMLLILLLIQS